MFSFRNDYSEGCHPRILEALLKYNMIQEDGYGMDRHSLSAKQKIQDLVGCGDGDVHLISGGTQTNLLAISAFLRPHEAVISAETGHIAMYETGAIEATGHKVITVKPVEGKLTLENIQAARVSHHFEHMVKPKLVYISNPTEYGTVYNRDELKALYDYCQEHDLLLYCDGARLGMAVATGRMTLKDMYHYTDAFFIGGTKVGALLGEALVIKNMVVKDEFRYLTKQRGALLAKGRVLGIQFETLFEDDLYVKLAAHANEMAQKLVWALKAEGCEFLLESPTNQIFPIMSNTKIDILSQSFGFYVWEPVDADRSAIRLITSWATQEADVEAFMEAFKNSK